MIVVAFIYLLICLLGIKIGAQEDYLSKEKTSSIKGIFILLVFLVILTPTLHTLINLIYYGIS